MWSLRPVTDGGFIMALGNASECVDTQCDYLGQLIRLDSNGDIIWEKTGSFIFPGEEDTLDLASVAAEWIFINSEGQIASVNDLEFGIGLEIIE